MTIKEANIYIRNELKSLYPQNEISAFAKIIFSDVFGLSSTDLIVKENFTFSEKDFENLKNIVNRLKKYEPLQYIIGFTEFYGLKFTVNPNVLIPRPETEELVDLIINDNKNEKNLKILDVGTGSGCIAVSLGKNLPEAKIFAFDISGKALETAQTNALINKVKISFFQEDILNKNIFSKYGDFNIIVSNPPYVKISEKEKMQANVLKYEPETALFVFDEKPLIFYEAVCKFAGQKLMPGGKLYFEINEVYGKEVSELLINYGFTGITIIKDINGKDRIAKAYKKF